MIRNLLALAVLPTLLCAADLHIDHVSVAGRDLQKMRAALSSLGIASEFGGPHANHATEMAITSFPDGSYLELIALQSNPDLKAVAAHDWSAQLQNDAGPAAWAVRLDDIDAERARLQSAHVSVSRPERSGRARPDGVKLVWDTAQVGTEPRGTYFPFLIRDITPREQRAFVAGRPTTSEFRGITRVVIATRDLRAAIARFRAAYQWPAPAELNDPALGARVAVFAGTPVVLAASLGNRSWIEKRIGRFGEGPCAYVFGASKAGLPPPPSRKPVSTSHWGTTGNTRLQIDWLDERALGWRLGVE